jgi:hypothetical protein
MMVMLSGVSGIIVPPVLFTAGAVLDLYHLFFNGILDRQSHARLDFSTARNVNPSLAPGLPWLLWCRRVLMASSHSLSLPNSPSRRG